MRSGRPLRRLAVVCALLGAAGPAGAEQPSCTRVYARAFPGLHEAAGARRLRVDTAQAEVAQLFNQRPDRCEPGAFAYFLGQLMSFTGRALRSGATAQTPKEGWIRAAAHAAAYGPRTVPQGEYYEDLYRLDAARRSLRSLLEEAGAGAEQAVLFAAFSELVPTPGPYGPALGILPPAGPIPAIEPPPGVAAPPPPDIAAAPTEAGAGLAEAYVTRGGALFKSGEFDASAEELKKAYLLRPKAVYLFNIAQAYRRGGRPREALAMYREFLEKDPKSTLYAETKNYVHDIEALLAEQESAQKIKTALAQKEKQTKNVQMELVVAEQRADRSERERKKPVYKRPWFWGVLGGAVVLVGVGVGAALGTTLNRDPQTDGGIVAGHF